MVYVERSGAMDITGLLAWLSEQSNTGRADPAPFLRFKHNLIAITLTFHSFGIGHEIPLRIVYVLSLPRDGHALCPSPSRALTALLLWYLQVQRAAERI